VVDPKVAYASEEHVMRINNKVLNFAVATLVGALGAAPSAYTEPPDRSLPVQRHVTIEVPDDMVVEAEGPEGAGVFFDVIALDHDENEIAVQCEPESGSIFPLGKTRVVCTAVDEEGNSTDASFWVTVSDATPPEAYLSMDWGATATASRNVELELEAYDVVDVVAYKVWEGLNEPSAWIQEMPPASLNWTLSPTEGEKTLSFKVRDGSGHESTVASSSIVLDAVPSSSLFYWPQDLAFNRVMNDPNPVRPQILTLFNMGEIPLTWSSESVPTFTVQPNAGTIPPNQEIYLLVSPILQEEVSEGIYTASLSFVSPEAENGAQTCSLSFQVIGDGAPAISCTSQQIRLCAPEGSVDPVTETIILSKFGADPNPIRWFIAGLDDAPWLEVGPPSGELTDGAATISLQASAPELEPGLYAAPLQIFAPGAKNSPLLVTVILNVDSVGVYPSELHVSLEPGKTVTQSCSIRSSTAPWSVAEDAPWLEVSPTQGGPSEHASVELSFKAVDLLPGTSWTVVRVSDGAKSKPRFSSFASQLCTAPTQSLLGSAL
jgi:hypothetical protein